MDENGRGLSVSVGDRLPDVCVAFADGRTAMLSALVQRPTVIALVRYFGCMPCRDFLYTLTAARADLDAAGVDVLGVGRAADYQIDYLEGHGVDFPLVLDPDQELSGAVGLGRFPWWKLLEPSTWRKYLRSAGRARQGRITNHPLQSPGVLIVEPDLTLRHVFRGETIGDYPPIDLVVAKATRR